MTLEELIIEVLLKAVRCAADEVDEVDEGTTADGAMPKQMTICCNMQRNKNGTRCPGDIPTDNDRQRQTKTDND